MRRLLVLFAVPLAVLVAAPAPAAPVELMPGVSSDRQVQFTPHGPVAFTVITAPPPGAGGGLYKLQPVLSGGTIAAPRARVTQIQKLLATTAITAGISGDFFNASSGIPNGIFIQDGLYHHGPAAGRSSLGIDAGGTLRVTRFSFTGTWKGTGQRRPLAGINQRPKGNQTVLFTPAWGTATPSIAGSTAVVLQPFPGTKPNTDLEAKVAAVPAGATSIPSDGAVLVATGAEAPKLASEAPVETTVTTRLILPSAWADTVAAIGGGPLLVRNGRPVFRNNENFDVDQLTARDARGGVGQLADGRIVMVAVDGGRPGFSVGMTTYELSQTMARLGAVTAIAVEPGKAVSAAFQGQLLNRPSDPSGERAVKEALLIQYFGAYAAPPTNALVGRHNVGTGQQLSYTIVRPSTVRATLVAPDGTETELDAGARQPGTYRFAAPPLEKEGTWRWRVAATDDNNRQSTAERTFRVDFTVSELRVPATTRSLAVRFTLARPAAVTLQLETRAGTVVAKVRAPRLEAGAQSLVWNGRLTVGGTAPPGLYTARMFATSDVGTMDVSAPFALRR